MSYTPKTWTTGETITAAELNAIEQGVQGAASTADTANSGLSSKVNSSTYTTGLAGKADTSSLAAVATSGSYTDLTNKPTIPAPLPTQTSNSGKFLTTDGTTPSWGTPAGSGGSVTSADIADASTVGKEVLTAADAPTARTSLGLGSAATEPASAFDPAGSADAVALPSGATVGQMPIKRASGTGWGAMESVGLFVPDGWGSYARAALAAAGTAKAVVNCAGDSLTQGQAASNVQTTSWVGRLATYLQAAKGDGGSGYSPANNGGAMYATNAVGAWAYSGAWTTSYNLNYGTGPASMFIEAGVGLGVTVTATSPPLRGRFVTLYYDIQPTSNPGGTIQWKIDGVSQADINTQGAASSGTTVGKVTVDMGAGNTGPHTVFVSTTGQSPTVYTRLFGASAENSTGVVVNRFGKSGAGSGSFARPNPPSDASPALWSGGANYPGDLHIYALGVNNVTSNSATTALQFQRDIQDHLTQVMAAKSGATDVLFVMPHVGKWDDGGGDSYIAMINAAEAAARSYGAAFLNLWAKGRGSWDWMNAQSYWGSGTPGVAGTDGVHLSDAGHQWWFDQMKPVIDLVLNPAV